MGQTLWPQLLISHKGTATGRLRDGATRIKGTVKWLLAFCRPVIRRGLSLCLYLNVTSAAI